MRAHRLIIFVKAPRPGFVKSRLAATLGQEAAAEAYCILVDCLLTNLSLSTGSGNSQRDEAAASKVRTTNSAFRTPHSTELWITPDDALAEIQHWLRPTWRAFPQGGGDLGERMQRAFHQAFATGAERVVLIGSDCPTVTTDDIERAWKALASHDIVLGPAADGGYWLIGLRSVLAELFEGIAWSTNAVLGDTLERAAQIGLRVQLLSERTDIDTENDWQEFLRRQSCV